MKEYTVDLPSGPATLQLSADDAKLLGGKPVMSAPSSTDKAEAKIGAEKAAATLNKQAAPANKAATSANKGNA